MTSTEPSTGEPPFGQGGITQLGFHLRDLFRAKEWSRLQAELDLEELWYFDAPLTKEAALELAAEALVEYDEIDVELDRIQKSERTDTEASGTYTCVLMAFDRQRLKQLEVDFDLHLGFRRGEGEEAEEGAYGGWRLERLGVTAATPLPLRHPESDDSATLGPQGVMSSLAVEADGHVVIYVPMRLPVEQARALLASASAEAAAPATESEDSKPADEAEDPSHDPPGEAL